jgi:hypothetical protein
MEDYYARNSIDDQRRELILQRLEEERQSRRQHVREGTIEQFQLEDITDSNNYSHYDNPYYEEQQMSEMKDPSQILYMEPDEEYQNYAHPEMIYDVQQEYYEQEQPIQSYPYPNQMHHYQQPQEHFGYNPENLYDPNTMQCLVQPDVNKENQRTFDNISNNKIKPYKKQKPHERLSKHNYVSDSGRKNCNR